MLWVFENNLLRETFGPMSVQDYIMRILMISNLHQILFGDRIESTEMGGARSTYREEEIFIQCLAGNTEVNRPLGIPMRR